MQFRKCLLVGILCTLFLTACGPQENTDDNQPLPAANGQKINDNTYTYYYGQTCGHCKKVEDYLKSSGVDQRITITAKEVSLPNNQANRDTFFVDLEEAGVSSNKAGTPTVVVTPSNGNKFVLIGQDEVITHFKQVEEQIRQFSS